VSVAFWRAILGVHVPYRWLAEGVPAYGPDIQEKVFGNENRKLSDLPKLGALHSSSPRYIFVMQVNREE
jgi:hypothetical protein